MLFGEDLMKCKDHLEPGGLTSYGHPYTHFAIHTTSGVASDMDMRHIKVHKGLAKVFGQGDINGKRERHD
jgi:hypothetical protein